MNINEPSEREPQSEDHEIKKTKGKLEGRSAQKAPSLRSNGLLERIQRVRTEANRFNEVAPSAQETRAFKAQVKLLKEEYLRLKDSGSISGKEKKPIASGIRRLERAVEKLPEVRVTFDAVEREQKYGIRGLSNRQLKQKTKNRPPLKEFEDIELKLKEDEAKIKASESLAKSIARAELALHEFPDNPTGDDVAILIDEFMQFVASYSNMQAAFKLKHSKETQSQEIIEELLQLEDANTLESIGDALCQELDSQMEELTESFDKTKYAASGFVLDILSQYLSAVEVQLRLPTDRVAAIEQKGVQFIEGLSRIENAYHRNEIETHIAFIDDKVSEALDKHSFHPEELTSIINTIKKYLNKLSSQNLADPEQIQEWDEIIDGYEQIIKSLDQSS